MTHFWHQQQEQALSKALYRSIHLGRTNPDYIALHPTEHKFQSAQADQHCYDKCTPEAKDRITKLVKKKQKFYHIPTVERPKRINRE